jgi:hypothetical protein
MLYISSLSGPVRRQLQHWSQDRPPLAQRAQLVLWSARGWSVPALAQVFHCCRRTVRRWLHAFLEQGLSGLHGLPLGRPPQTSSGVSSTTTLDQAGPAGRMVPVVPLSVPEVRRIFNYLASMASDRPDLFWHWSIYRRYKQALAMRSHYKKRGAKPPDFEYLRL